MSNNKNKKIVMILGEIFIQFSLIINPEVNYFSLVYTISSNNYKKNKKSLLAAYASLRALFPNVWATCVEASRGSCLVSKGGVKITIKITKGE